VAAFVGIHTPTIRVHTRQNSQPRSPAWNTSVAIASTSPGTGTPAWFCLFQRQSLAEALHLIESEPHFEPC
jgi:hypothetical protein